MESTAARHKSAGDEEGQSTCRRSAGVSPDAEQHAWWAPACRGVLDDDEPGVRAWAAAQVLFWNEPDARRVLECLSSSDTFPFNFNADMTLREFDAGRLRL